MQSKYLTYIFIVFLTVNTIAACTNESEQSEMQEEVKNKSGNTNIPMEQTGESIFATISNIDSLSTFSKMLEAVDLPQTLDADSSYTIFAPTDKALQKLPDGILEVLMKPESKERLAELLKVHLTNEEYSFSDFTDHQTFNSMEGVELKIRKKSGVTTVSQAKIIKPNIKTTNGFIHIVDRFIVHLQPPASSD